MFNSGNSLLSVFFNLSNSFVVFRLANLSLSQLFIRLLFCLIHCLSASNTTLYQVVLSFLDCSGMLEEFKFVMLTNGGTSAVWENPSTGHGDPWNNNNRFFTMVDGGLTLPPVYLSDISPGPTPVNVDVTFQVDMSAQVLNGVFDPTVDTVGLAGGFDGWSGGNAVMTNNPNGSNTNLYSTVIHFYDFPTAVPQYKFVCYGLTIAGTIWENPNPPTIGGNRFFTLGSNATVVLPSVYFSDLSAADLLPADTIVTFSVSMTNAIATSGHVFDPTADAVYLNGASGVWWGWGATPADWQLTNNPVGSEVYSLDVLFPKGKPVVVNYKYTINGGDNEAASGLNHVRYIRSVGSYVMPLDTFGNQYVESSFGNLTAASAPGGKVAVSWLGRPGVRLQTRANLGSSGSWVEHAETDGLSSTNWTANGGSLFFRLVKH